MPAAKPKRQPPVPVPQDSDAWEEIIECTDDVISDELLSWAGLGEKWWPEDVADCYNFYSDVAADSAWLQFSVDSWDGGPGTCGSVYVVSTCDKKAAIKDLRARCREFVGECRRGAR